MGATSHKRWGRARVVDVCEVAQHVRQVVLAPDRVDAPAPPGSHIDIGVYVNGRADVRSYSVVGSGAYGSEIILGVQLARQSRGGSAFIHQLLRGQPVQITQPLQNFPLNYGRSGYVLAAGGIGITALVAMGKALKARGADYRFVYGARSRGLMAFVDELAAEHGDRMDLRIDDEDGPLDVDELVASVPAGGELYVCGPAPMLDAIKAAKANGAADDQLKPALDLHRKAQWRLDFIQSENSMGFHAAQESARILAESIDYSRQGQLAAQAFVRKIMENVPVFDTGGRAATQTFVEREIGDVLVTFETETRQIAAQYADRGLVAVTPPVSLFSAFPVAVVTENTDRNGTTELATAYLNWLYSPEAQRILAENGNRVNDETVKAEFADKFQQVELMTVEDVFGGWDKIQYEHLAVGGILDKVFVKR